MLGDTWMTLWAQSSVQKKLESLLVVPPALVQCHVCDPRLLHPLLQLGSLFGQISSSVNAQGSS